VPVSVPDVVEPTDEAPPDEVPPARDRSAQLAAAAFGVYLAVALPVLVFGLGRDHWFFYDEWDFLADREIDDAGDLLRPHNEHWSTIPIILYRLLYAAFGLRTYRPYQVMVVLSHLALALVLRAVMRRAGVHPWTATLVAAVLVLFGSGQQNIVWAFQVGFVGAAACGFAQLLLADHDGPIGRRDLAGLAVGFAGLLFSGVAVTAAVVTGIALLLRRGWRPAAFHTVPLGLVYVGWYVVVDPQQPPDEVRSGLAGTLGEIWGFERTGIGESFKALTYNPWGLGEWLGLLLAVVLVVGLAVALRERGPASVRGELAPVVALLAGPIVFMGISGYGRGFFGAAAGSASRYLYLIGAMLLPALAVAIDALMRRHRVAGLAALALLLSGVPGNIARFGEGKDTLAASYHNKTEDLIEGMAHSPWVTDAAPDGRPLLGGASEVTTSWLADQARLGNISEPRALDDATAAEVAVYLALGKVQADIDPEACTPVPVPGKVALDGGELLQLEGSVSVTLVKPEDRAGATALYIFSANDFDPATALVAMLDVTVQLGGNATAMRCPPP
jgi:hypothetical protein